MIKKIFKEVNLILNRYLDVFAILFLVLNFMIWYINDDRITTIQFSLYQQGLWILVVGLLINYHKLKFLDFIKENIFFILIFIIAIYQSFFIIMNFNGIIVDMGMRSNELIMQAFPSFLLILAAYRHVHRKAFIVALSIVLALILGYATLVLMNKFSSLESFKGISILLSGDRHQSILNNPNALGEYMFIGVFIVFFLSMISKNIWLKLLILIPLPILFYVLILSGSRTAIFMSVIFYVMMNLYFIYFKKNSRKILILGNLVLILAAYLAVIGVFNDLLAILKTDLDLSGRDTIWFNTLKIINDHSFRGIGYNNFTYVYNELFRSITSPHNMLLGIYTELGIFGAILTIGWFTYLVITNHNMTILHKKDPLTTYLILFNAFYITYFIGQMTEYSFLKVSTINTLFLALQGINFGIRAVIREDKDKLSYFLIGYGLVLIVPTILFLINPDYASILMLCGISGLIAVAGAEFGYQFIQKKMIKDN